MAKIDIDKFVCSIIYEHTRKGFYTSVSIFSKALADQGLEYKDGKLQEIADTQELKLEKINPKVDIDAMVGEYRKSLPYTDDNKYEWCLAELHCTSYRQGLEDMYNLKK